jgi:hypothetical protein
VLKNTFAKWTLLKAATNMVKLLPFVVVPSFALAQTVDDTPRMATDGAAEHLFLGNPASLKPSSLRGGSLLTSIERETEFNQEDDGGDVISNKVTVESVHFSALVDLGAGAGLGLSHMTQFKEVSTTSDIDETPRLEYVKTTVTTGSVIVELTSEVVGAFAIRGFYSESSVFGSPFMSEGTETRYVIPSAAPGYGASYIKNNMGASYMYYLPIRGKSTIQSEEYLVVESGEILFDAYYEVDKNYRVGIGGKRWIHEIDDRAEGTTADDNQTNISMFGMDIDQYVKPEQRYEIALDYQASSAIQFRVGLSQQKDSFHFNEMQNFGGLDARQNDDHNEYVKSNRYRVAMKFVSNNLQIHVGIGRYSKEHTLPESMNAGTYKSSVSEQFVTLDMKL